MIAAVHIGRHDLVGFLPEQIDDVDSPAFLMHPEDRTQPTLAVDGPAFESQFQPISTRLDAEIGNVRVKAQPLGQGHSLA